MVTDLFDRPKYRQRNIIERMFGWLKENRRIVTRFDKLAKATPQWSRWLVPCGVCDTFFQTESRVGTHLSGRLLPLALSALCCLIDIHLIHDQQALDSSQD